MYPISGNERREQTPLDTCGNLPIMKKLRIFFLEVSENSGRSSRFFDGMVVVSGSAYVENPQDDRLFYKNIRHCECIRFQILKVS